MLRGSRSDHADKIFLVIGVTLKSILDDAALQRLLGLTPIDSQQQLFVRALID
jgi:hypothetical protein